MKNEKKSLIDGVIRYKHIVYLILAMLIAVGIWGISNMNKDEFPTFELTQGLVAAVYPGASSQEVEQQVAKPLEQVLFSMKEVNRKNLRIVSKDGMCYIYVDLTSPINKKDEVWSKIRLKLNEAKMTLPPGVLAILVMDDFSAISSSLIALESDDKGYVEMKDYADKLADELREIPELAAVKIYGAQDEEIAVTLDLERLSAYGISPSSLTLGYQTSTLQMPSGSFETDYTVSPIHVSSLVSDEQEISDRIVYSDPDGNTIRLSDIATVERRLKKATSVVEQNGGAAIILSVEMRPDNDIVAFGKKLDKVIDNYSQTLPDSVTLSRITDQPKVVGTSVFSFLRDLVISMLVVILVMLMLFPMRSALIASSGVPVCTAVALAIMYLTGIDLNTVTLAALIVVLGMIVDDSIITMDGYMDHLGRGKSRLDAAKDSFHELITPMFMATMSISLMFFPMLGLISGYLGDFVQLFPWVIAIALMASLAYATFVVPSLETHFIREARPSGNNIITRAQNKFFSWMQHAYDKAQDFCFRFPKLTILTGVGAIALGLLMFSRLNVQMMPMADRDFFAVEVNLESGARLSETREVVDSLQKMMLDDGRVESVTAFIGSSAPRFNATYAPSLPSESFAQLIVNTTSAKATKELLPLFEEKYEHCFPQALIRIKQMDYQGALPVEIMVKGNDQDQLKDVSDKILGYMRTLDDEIKWVHSTSDDCISCVEVKLDPTEAARLGVNKAITSLSLAGAFNGQSIASVWEGDKEIPVNLYSASVSENMGYDTVSDQLVATSVPGVYVPLRQVASVEPDFEPAQRTRYAGQEAVIIAADMKYHKSQPVSMAKIKDYISSLDIPEGVDIEYAGMSAINTTVIPQIAVTFICAVMVLFFFLLFHFKKISLAILTIVLSSLCLFGAFFGLWIFGLDFSITAVLGLISLVGIIVRNGIIMFEYAEELRFEEGIPVKEAAMLAGKRRMRPIFLTSATTALGVLPMIISGDLLWLPLGVVICFGTMLSVFLITLIMPVSYWQIFVRDKRSKEVEE